MSVGPPSVDKDNAGQECIVYDVIINPKARQRDHVKSSHVLCLLDVCGSCVSMPRTLVRAVVESV